MSVAALGIISDSMDELGINYEFMEWTSKTKYPYFTGEYQEQPSTEEDGEQETTFILNGFARGKNAKLLLEDVKEKIKQYFPNVGGRLVTAENGTAVAIYFANSLTIPSEDAELKKIQINLTIKEWSVN